MNLHASIICIKKELVDSMVSAIVTSCKVRYKIGLKDNDIDKLEQLRLATKISLATTDTLHLDNFVI